MKDLRVPTNDFTDEKSVINYYRKDFQNEVRKYFKRTSIIDLVTKYELYYHISLGNYVFETFLDIEETTKKLQDLKLEVTPLKALFKIYEIIEEYSSSEDFEKKLEFYIRKKASLQALNDFVENDKELVGQKYYRQRKMEDIENDILFNEMMQFNFEVNYQKTFEHYNGVLTQQFLEEIENRILNH